MTKVVREKYNIEVDVKIKLKVIFQEENKNFSNDKYYRNS